MMTVNKVLRGIPVQNVATAIYSGSPVLRAPIHQICGNKLCVRQWHLPKAA
jgi:hypothetical protein